MAANVENGTLFGGANLNLAGNGSNNTLTRNTGNNLLFGHGGNDIMLGGNGNDRLYGGAGNDKLAGGSGSDIFVFNTTPSASTNIDTITDFNVAADTFWIDNAFLNVGANGALAAAAFRIGAAAADADDRVIYNASTGALIYDVNGSGAGGAIQIAKLTAGLALTSADFVII
jgi:serralysin